VFQTYLRRAFFYINLSFSISRVSLRSTGSRIKGNHFLRCEIEDMRIGIMEYPQFTHSTISLVLFGD
jgi:hypothetical protein